MAKEIDTLREAVDRRLGALRVPEDLTERVLAKAAQKRPRMISLRRPIALAAVLCVMLIGGVGVFAASPAVPNLFSVLGAQVSSLLQPVDLSCTDAGIETTVVAAMNDSNSIDIYVSVKDLEGARIDEHSMLCDVALSDTVFRPYVHLVQFDEKSATATFLIEGSSSKSFDGKRVKLSIGGILLNGRDYESENVGVNVENLAAAFPAPAFQPLEGKSYTQSAVYFDDAKAEYDCTRALMPAESDGSMDGIFPWGTLTAAGISDNMLHLLVAPSAAGQRSRVDVSLSGGTSAELSNLPRYTVDFNETEKNSHDSYFEYTEYILPLPAKPDLKKLSVSYSGTVYSELISGAWTTTFKLESLSKQHIAYPDITIDDWRISRVELSTMGISVTAEIKSAGWFSRSASNSASGPPSPPEIRAYTVSGDPIDFNSSSTSTDGNGYVLKNQFSSPTPLELIGRVTVGGQEISFSK